MHKNILSGLAFALVTGWILLSIRQEPEETAVLQEVRRRFQIHPDGTLNLPPSESIAKSVDELHPPFKGKVYEIPRNGDLADGFLYKVYVVEGGSKYYIEKYGRSSTRSVFGPYSLMESVPETRNDLL